jgi:hypothetical protein
MGAREATHVYRLRHWAKKISQCHNSGMTVTAWCESQNINIKATTIGKNKCEKQQVLSL